MGQLSIPKSLYELNHLSDRWEAKQTSHRSLRMLLILALIGLGGNACRGLGSREHSPQSLPPTPTPGTFIQTLPSKRGGLRGQILIPSGTSIRLFVYLARITWDSKGGQGAYLLDPSIGPWTEIGPDGRFHLLTVEPGDYIILVGSSPEGAIPLQVGPGRAYIVRVRAGEVLDIGVWPSPIR
jgi:hypothetical protein